MATLTGVLQHLRSEQQRLQKQLQRVEAALSALAGLGGRRPGRPRGSKNVRRRRGMSASGRARIAAAQRARWAKIRAQKKGS